MPVHGDCIWAWAHTYSAWVGCNLLLSTQQPTLGPKHWKLYKNPTCARTMRKQENKVHVALSSDDMKKAIVTVPKHGVVFGDGTRSVQEMMTGVCFAIRLQRLAIECFETISISFNDTSASLIHSLTHIFAISHLLFYCPSYLD